MEGALGIWFDTGANNWNELDNWFAKYEQPAVFQCKNLVQVRRYESISEGPRYFCLYEYTTASAVSSENTHSRFLCGKPACADPTPQFIRGISHLGGGLVLKTSNNIGCTAMTFQLVTKSRIHVSSILEVLSRQIFPLPGITSLKLWLSGVDQSFFLTPSDVSFPRRATIFIEGIRPGFVASAWNKCSGHQAFKSDWPLLGSTAYRLLQVASDSN